MFTGATSTVSAGDRPSPPSPVVTPARGFYDEPFQVTLSVGAEELSIWYTLNGEPPVPGRGLPYRGAIPIRSTTVLRAAAFRDGTNASVSVTHTYLFWRDVVRQTGAEFPANWGTNQSQAVPADYAMDPEITGNPLYRDGLLSGLRSLPALSLVMASEDLFGAARGIYAHPRETGVEWERAASVELIHPDGSSGFQANTGARIQGGWNRRPEESPKHSFRIVFKKKYGPGKLRFPLYGDEGAQEFDEFILRAGCNNTWLHWSGTERRRGEFLRDQWMRDSYAAMGHPSARGRFVHLFLNGLYWGLYNPTERPSAPFVAGHLGGKPEHYDVRNADNVLEGDDVAWRKLFELVNAGVTGATEYAAVSRLVDVPGLIDYLILNFYGANADWDRGSNWYAARRRRPAGPFQFFVWDGERTLEAVTDNSMAADDDLSPTRLFHRLRMNADFRREFSQRARRHLSVGGVLSPNAAAERYRRLASQIEQAVIAESARWGDYRRDVHRYKEGPYELYTRDDHWRPEVQRLLNDYFPRRSEAVLVQFRKADLVEP